MPGLSNDFVRNQFCDPRHRGGWVIAGTVRRRVIFAPHADHVDTLPEDPFACDHTLAVVSFAVGVNGEFMCLI
jgi:hypothetical protein